MPRDVVRQPELMGSVGVSKPQARLETSATAHPHLLILGLTWWDLSREPLLCAV